MDETAFMVFITPEECHGGVYRRHRAQGVSQRIRKVEIINMVGIDERPVKAAEHLIKQKRTRSYGAMRKTPSGDFSTHPIAVGIIHWVRSLE